MSLSLVSRVNYIPNSETRVVVRCPNSLIWATQSSFLKRLFLKIHNYTSTRNEVFPITCFPVGKKQRTSSCKMFTARWTGRGYSFPSPIQVPNSLEAFSAICHAMFELALWATSFLETCPVRDFMPAYQRNCYFPESPNE